MLKEPVEAKAKFIQIAKMKGTKGGIDIEVAHPRQTIGIALSSRRDIYELLKGSKYAHGVVAGNPEKLPTTATSIEAEVTVVWHPTVISRGHEYTISINNDEVRGKFIDIIRKRSIGGTWESRRPDIIRANEQAIVRIETPRPFVVETKDKVPWMSRFVFRDGIRITGFGSCEKILK